MLKFIGLRYTNHQGHRIQVAALEEFGKVRLMSKGVVAQQIRELLTALQALQGEPSVSPITPSNSEETDGNSSPE